MCQFSMDSSSSSENTRISLGLSLKNSMLRRHMEANSAYKSASLICLFEKVGNSHVRFQRNTITQPGNPSFYPKFKAARISRIKPDFKKEDSFGTKKYTFQYWSLSISVVFLNSDLYRLSKIPFDFTSQEVNIFSYFLWTTFLLRLCSLLPNIWRHSVIPQNRRRALPLKPRHCGKEAPPAYPKTRMFVRSLLSLSSHPLPSPVPLERAGAFPHPSSRSISLRKGKERILPLENWPCVFFFFPFSTWW